VERVEVRRAGTVLSCLDGGQSDDIVVLLHGLAGSAREMSPTAAALLPGRRVIAIDQRGHGHSTRRPADVSRQAYVDDVVAVMERLAGGRPVTLVGQSMGGHTALLTAARNPGLVQRLVLLEAGVGGDETGGYPARLGAWFASWPVPFRSVQAAADFLGPSPIAQAWIGDLEQCTDGLRPRFEPDVMQAAITGVAEKARWDEWRRVKAPTLLVRGQNGTVPDRETQRLLELRPDVTHVVVPDAGHDVHLEQPEAWLRVLTAFLDSRPVG
jgi:pimeloyl-ACP methyl ester carboxylesterase